MSLSNNPALITAFSNDNHPDLIYAQQVLNYGEKKDILFAISTSGNSKNIIHASKIAKLLGLRIIGLTGKNGGQLKKFTDVLINVNETETYKVQELHLPIYHLICLILENEFYGEE